MVPSTCPAVQLPNLPGVDYMIKLLTGKDTAIF